MKSHSTKILVGTIVALVLVGSYHNSSQIHQLKPDVLNHDLPSPSRRTTGRTNNNGVLSQQQMSLPSCLKARTDTVPTSMFGKLPRPFVNLGFPKMGTSSLHSFFNCGNLKSHHFGCGKDLETNRRTSCANCIRKSIAANKPPLDLCEEADMYSQIDSGTFFPQIEYLDEFHDGHPRATFFLTFRNMTKWYNSLSNWPPRPKGPHMNDRLQKFEITGFPSGKGKNEEEFTEWFCNHVLRVREMVDASDHHHLIEVDIEDDTIARRMSGMFNVSAGCWGHSNTNLILHPDVNMSEVTVGKRQKQLLKKMRSDIEDDDDGEDDDRKDDNNEEGWNYRHDDSYRRRGRAENKIKDDDEVRGDIFRDAQDDDKTRLIDTNSCFQARNNTIPSSLYRKLPKPFINLGFPKMGTTSLHHFFQCGGITSYHYLCGKGGKTKPLCAECIQQSVSRGQQPFAQCQDDGEAWTQIDNGKYFPQIQLLDKFVEGYPQATFILLFRNMEKWYNSMENWPPNRTKHEPLTQRLLKLSLPGLSKTRGDKVSTFSKWFCDHVNRVRDIVAKSPSHSLVEIDIEDPAAGEYLETIFGIKRTCFAKKNSHSKETI